MTAVANQTEEQREAEKFQSESVTLIDMQTIIGRSRENAFRLMAI